LSAAQGIVPRFSLSEEKDGVQYKIMKISFKKFKKGVDTSGELW
jgi:hypothetical protein